MKPNTMQIIGYLIHALARGLDSIGSAARFLAGLLNGLLPVLLPPEQLNRLMRMRYQRIYTEDLSEHAPPVEKHALALWEVDLLDRYAVCSGRMLVLGSGYGREAIPIAHRGLTVVGVDSNETAVRTADRLAKHSSARARFHRADFLRLPYRPASFDCVLLSSLMYSAIPGISFRQACLQNLARVLTPGGLIILGFESRQFPRSRLKTLRDRLCLAMARIPGANAGYQAGDNCQNGHFLHEFQDKDEICREFLQTGLTIQELDWDRGFAVLAQSQAVTPPPGRPTQEPAALHG
jgi:SAM-dependent methyltransferase